MLIHLTLFNIHPFIFTVYHCHICVSCNIIYIEMVYKKICYLFIKNGNLGMMLGFHDSTIPPANSILSSSRVGSIPATGKHLFHSFCFSNQAYLLTSLAHSARVASKTAICYIFSNNVTTNPLPTCDP
jgi:hypothetical protein